MSRYLNVNKCFWRDEISLSTKGPASYAKPLGMRVFLYGVSKMVAVMTVRQACENRRVRQLYYRDLDGRVTQETDSNVIGLKKKKRIATASCGSHRNGIV